ncbi:MAG: hypothetical protein EHM61_25885 [Acidobacteria bacterium]|nr:MAG: hypothetical protein EHM61_25885 [Acidobacteriota bacterium]
MIYKRWLLLLFVLFVSPLQAQFNAVETDNLRLIYFGQMQAYLVPYAVQCFENSFKVHRELFKYDPKEKITIVLHDLYDSGNGSADSIPRNFVFVAVAPPSYVFETLPGNERINGLMHHELVHVVTLDQASSADRKFRSVFFGKVVPSAENPVTMAYAYLTTPRRYAPRWYLEGIAVFVETWMAGGLGRALGAYDEMAFRALVRDNAQIWDRVGLESEGKKTDFQVGAISYLYGTRFMSYLAYQYGPESLLKWTARTDGTTRYFASQFERVYGRPLDAGWQEWIEWEQEFQGRNLATVRQTPVTKYLPVSSTKLGSVSPAFYDAETGEVYLGVNYPGQVAHLAAMNLKTGHVRKIVDVKGTALYYVTSLAYDPETKKLFYSTDNNNWRDLRSVDVRTGKSELLMKDCRVGDLAFNSVDGSLWGVRHDNGFATLVRIPRPYNDWNQIHTWPYGQCIYDLAVSPDGKRLVAAQTEIGGKQSLIKLEIEDLMAKRPKSESLSEFDTSSPANFVFSSDGRYLFGSSYYSGISNIYRYDFQTKETQIFSNADTGFFRPVPIGSDKLLIFCYTSQGFEPGIIPIEPANNVNAIRFLGQEVVEKHPIVKRWIAPPPSSVNAKEVTKYEGKYRAVQDVKLTSIYPLVEGYKDSFSYGAQLNMASPFTSVTFKASVSPDSQLDSSERLHLKMNLNHLEWKVRAAFNNADFYDLFGPTKTSRKGYSAGVEKKTHLLYDEPSRFMDYTLNANFYGGLERLPEYQNVSANYDKLLTFGGIFNYQYLTKSLGAVDNEKGYQFQVISKNNWVSGNFFPRLYSNLDYGFALPLKHSSVWLRNSAGYSFGSREEPFANFYFGGFGNNWIDRETETRYRESYSFPGVELNEVGGKEYAKTLVEWNLPALLFKRVGNQTAYLNWLRPTIFTSGIVTNIGQEATRRSLANIGAQLDLRLVVMSHRDLTFSVGGAAAFEKHHGPSRELMISLRLH